MNQSVSSPNPAGGRLAPATPAVPPASLLLRAREVFDEFMAFFVLVMFVRVFIVEHYKIPSGSMTPTLLGGQVAHVDADGDGAEDIVYWGEGLRAAPLVFLHREDRYLADPDFRVSPAQGQAWFDAGLVRAQYDHILVNRLAYWFRQPRRGEIVIFKVPPAIFQPEAPIYIKRLVGQPGEVLRFTDSGRLVVDGQLLDQPDFFRTQHYVTALEEYIVNHYRPSEMRYGALGPGQVGLEQIRVPKGSAYVFGDNTHGSLDSRYWGGVPLDHFKGRAVLRIWPLDQLRLLK